MIRTERFEQLLLVEQCRWKCFSELRVPWVWAVQPEERRAKSIYGFERFTWTLSLRKDLPKIRRDLFSSSCTVYDVLPIEICHKRNRLCKFTCLGFFWSYTGKSLKNEDSRLLFNSFTCLECMLKQIPSFVFIWSRDVTCEPCSGKLGISITYNKWASGRLVS